LKKLLIYFILILFIGASLNASVILGSFELVKGSVKLKSEGSLKRSNATKGMDVKKGDLISSLKEANAVIKLKDGSTLILDESSTLHFESDAQVLQEDGKIYYSITSRDARNALKVRTPFAIIGIKGTTFIVDTNKTSSVKLKEGLVGIQSLKEEFELYRKEVEAQYNDYLTEQEKEYQKFLSEQNKGAALMTKEFDLEEKNIITFDGQKVSESAWTKEDDAEFERFEALAESLK